MGEKVTSKRQSLVAYASTFKLAYTFGHDLFTHRPLFLYPKYLFLYSLFSIAHDFYLSL